MIVKDFLQLYKYDGIVQTISQQITIANKGSSFYVKGLCGALDTVLIAALSQEKNPFLLVCEEKEEANRYNDEDGEDLKSCGNPVELRLSL